MKSMSTREASEKFLAWAARELAAATVREYRRYLHWFTRHVKNAALQKLRAYHLVAFGTTWHRIQAVQRCWNWLAEVEYIARSPFNRVKRPRPGRRKRVFTRAEMARLIRGARPAFRAFIIAMRESLARPQEIRELRWCEIHTCDPSLSLDAALVEGRCYFLKEEYKGKDRRADPDEPRIIPISRRLGRAIVRITQRLDARRGEVFRTERGKPWTKEAVRLRMKRLREKLGMRPDARGEQLVAYSIRHTGGTAYTVAGVRDKRLASIMGHANTRTTARYQHPEPADVLAVVDSLRPVHTIK